MLVLVEECIKCLLSEYYKVIFMNRQVYFTIKGDKKRHQFAFLTSVVVGCGMSNYCRWLILLLSLDCLNQSLYLFFAFESSRSSDWNVIFVDNFIKWDDSIFGVSRSPK